MPLKSMSDNPNSINIREHIDILKREAEGTLAKIKAITYSRIDVSQEVARGLCDFYTGQAQWEESVLSERAARRRPSLTINPLPAIVHREIEKLRASGVEVDRETYQNMVISITSQGRDLVRVYNYLMSSIAELYCLITGATQLS